MAWVEYKLQYPCGLTGRDLVGAGITSIVARLDAVIKFSRPENTRFLEREKRVYERLGHDHPGVLQYFGSLDNGLLFKYARNGSIRQFYTRPDKSVPRSLKLRWIEQIAEAIVFVHSKRVLHGDISCNNILLDDELNARIADFAGSSIDGEDSLICYETSHELPGIDTISEKCELFALGSVFYEIMTSSKPYKELSDDEICAAYTAGSYPRLDHLHACRQIISNCWNQKYDSAAELLEDIRAEGIVIFLYSVQH